MAIAEGFKFEGVEGLRVGRLDLGLNTTVHLYRLGDTLIDCGMPHAWTNVRRFVMEEPIRRVLLTHHHEDHAGNAAAIAKQLKVPVMAHPLALPHLARGHHLRPYQRLLFGTPETVDANPFPETVFTDDGHRLIPVHTPGHSEDLTCYLEPDKGWLFTGDLFIGSNPRYLRQDEDLPGMMKSLRRVLALDFRVMFCGHRGVVTGGRIAVAEKLAYLEALRSAVQKLGRRESSISRITRTLLGREDMTSRATLYHFCKANLIRACMAGETKRDPSSGFEPVTR